MGRINPELRETIIELSKQGHRPSAIVRILPEKCDQSSIYRLLFKYKVTGSTKDIKKRKESKITSAISEFIEEIYSKDRCVLLFC